MKDYLSPGGLNCVNESCKGIRERFKVCERWKMFCTSYAKIPKVQL